MTPYRLPDGRVLVPRVADDGFGTIGDGMVACQPNDPLIWEWERWYRQFGEVIPPYPGGEAAFGGEGTVRACLPGLFGEAPPLEPGPLPR